MPSAHLKLDDETVSRMHAIIEVNGPGDVSIIDLGSTKGTFVNGQKVNKAKLQSGDTIVVGETRIELAIGAGEEATTRRPGSARRRTQDIIASTPRPAAPSLAAGCRGAPLAPPPRPRRSAGAAPPRSRRRSRPPSFAAPPVAAPAVRPPPGMAVGRLALRCHRAQPRRCAGFQPAMAGEADDLGGARAVEVAAMLGDSVVGVKHCIDPQGRQGHGATWALFAIGAAALLAFGFAF